MANSLTTEILADGPVNYIVKVVGVLDTSDLVATVLINPVTMSPINFGVNPTQFKIDRIVFAVENGLEVRLQWDATAPIYVMDLTGTGHQEYKSFGGLTNNAGAGKTGQLLISTQGWTAAAILSFSAVIECIKQP